MRNYFLLCIAIIGLFTSCKKEVEDFPLIQGHSYFPQEIGHWVVYDVEHTFYNDFLDTIEVNTYQIREEIVESFADNEGRNSVTIERHSRSGPEAAWSSNPQLIYATRDSAEGELIDGNLRFLKLVFPIVEGRQWFGNKYLDEDYINDEQFGDECQEIHYFNNWYFEYQEIEQATTVNDLPFEKTITVLQNNYEDLLDNHYSIEKYAEGVGLIYKEIRDLTYKSSILEPLEQKPWPDRANCGNIVVFKIADYNNPT